LACLNCLGYHGTSQEGARKIEAEGYEASGDENWLGRGVYFFGTIPDVTNGETEARAWAVYVKKCDNWAVIQVTINSEKFLDLVQNIGHRRLFEEAKRKMLEQHQRMGKAPWTFRDYIIFKYIDKKVGFEVIRAVVDAEPKEYLSNIVKRPQVQICVKATTCIKEGKILAKGRRNGLR
jgi:hypothetical protein